MFHINAPSLSIFYTVTPNKIYYKGVKESNSKMSLIKQLDTYSLFYKTNQREGPNPDSTVLCDKLNLTDYIPCINVLWVILLHTRHLNFCILRSVKKICNRIWAIYCNRTLLCIWSSANQWLSIIIDMIKSRYKTWQGIFHMFILL